MTAALTDKRFINAPRTYGWIDLAVVGLLAGFIYTLVTVAHEWSGPLQQVPAIHLETRYLPQYAFSSLSRGVMAYGVSFVFTMVYGFGNVYSIPCFPDISFAPSWRQVCRSRWKSTMSPSAKSGPGNVIKNPTPYWSSIMDIKANVHSAAA